MACLNGWQRSTMLWLRSTWNGCSWGGTSSTISASIIAMSCLITSRISCSTHAPAADPTSAGLVCRRRPYVRGACLPEIVKGHLRGNRNYTLEIHKLLTLELIQRQLIEQN